MYLHLYITHAQCTCTCSRVNVIGNNVTYTVHVHVNFVAMVTKPNQSHTFLPFHISPRRGVGETELPLPHSVLTMDRALAKWVVILPSGADFSL